MIVFLIKFFYTLWNITYSKTTNHLFCIFLTRYFWLMWACDCAFILTSSTWFHVKIVAERFDRVAGNCRIHQLLVVSMSLTSIAAIGRSRISLTDTLSQSSFSTICIFSPAFQMIAHLFLSSTYKKTVCHLSVT